MKTKKLDKNQIVNKNAFIIIHGKESVLIMQNENFLKFVLIYSNLVVYRYYNVEDYEYKRLTYSRQAETTHQPWLGTWIFADRPTLSFNSSLSIRPALFAAYPMMIPRFFED